MDLVYLDANASEPLHPAARAAMLAALEQPGNPASIHGAGRAARRVLESARESLAARFHAAPGDLIFTSGATEADALAIHALGAGRPVLIGATEHDAVRAAAPGAVIIPVRQSGEVDLPTLEALLRTHENALVCLMSANNETGVLHPLADAASLCARYHALLHVDAVQTAGRVEIDYLALGAASFAVSAHKLGGPLGAGALICAAGLADHIKPLIAGGGQERGRRGGTPALPALAGFAAAAMVARPDLRAARERIEQAARACGALVMGEAAPRLGNTSCLALPGARGGVRAETQVIALDMAGFCVSAGSACSSGKVARSHVLAAMGYADHAGDAIRVSLPWNLRDGDVDQFIVAYRAMAERALRKPGDISSSPPVRAA
ncbi:MAG TPA: aminotransferase class V-fold PLP-dependent enzyme [Acetobacteraceae bacterium]|nr:aminotransferase class V-fold PLP-dependent enzyme [Acetobacteraceae bacterium]